MSSTWRAFGFVLVGTVLVLTLGELSLRLAGDAIPLSSAWPTPESELKHRHLVLEGRHPDVVFLGSSFVEAAVDPEQMESGLEAYNLAMPFSSTATIGWWLREVVFEVSEPQVVVVGMPVWTDPDAVEPGVVDALATAASHSQSHREGLRLWQALGAFGQMDQSLARERLIGAGVLTDFGYQTAYANATVQRSSWERRRAGALTGGAKDELGSLLQAARHGARHVVMMVEPLASSIAPDSKDLDMFVADLRDVARESGATFWEPPRIFWQDDNYVDGVHFDARGASKFTQFVDGELLRLVEE